MNSITRYSRALLETFVYFCIFAGLSNSLTAYSRANQDENDHLMPIEGYLEPAYQTLLSHKLFLTPANYARIVILPSGTEGESAIAIYSKPRVADEVFITRTKAERNLWQAAWQLNTNLAKVPAVNITRLDRPFPKHVAAIVSESIRQVIAKRRPLTKTNRIIVDGTDIEFSIQSRDREAFTGLLTPDAKGKNGNALRRLTELLEQYCGAKLSDRENLTNKIQAEARNLKK